MTERVTIPRVPALPSSMDWDALRAEGLAHIQKLSGAIWTDHNVHDPGITTLELLAFALTDLAYRTGLPTADVLTGRDGELHPEEIARLMPAHEILTTAPRTVPDYRRLLMRVDGVRNAWMEPLAPGTCEVPVYADCARDELTFADTGEDGKAHHPVPISGLWRVLADLEPDDRLGAMNESALTHRVRSGPLKGAVLRFEVRDPDVADADVDLSGALDAFALGPVATVPGGYRTGLTVTLGGAAPLELPDCFVRVIDARPRADEPALEVTALRIRGVLEDDADDALIPSFFQKQRRRAAVLARIVAALHAHRGLCEDFLSIDHVASFLVGLCADVELAADADVERVQAHVQHAVETYLSPPVRYRTLEELLEAGTPVETIFDGPFVDFGMTAGGSPLFTKPGFVTQDELDATELRRAVHASDLVNLIVDIPGVVAIRNLQMQAYDGSGIAQGAPERWCLDVPPAHQPVLFADASKLLYFRGGIQFRPNRAEVAQTLAELRALDRRAVYSAPDQELPVPKGRWRRPDAFHPVQHDFPETYRIGTAGVSMTEGPERVARARQLKGYLTFFEQVLGDYLGQLTALRRLYSLDPSLDRSWFSLRLSGIAAGSGNAAGWDAEYLTQPAVYDDDLARSRLSESEEQFLERRNRLLDHLIARFAERFADYALLRYRMSSDRLSAAEELIEDKIKFLRGYPRISRDRGQAADVRPESAARIWDSDNVSGLERRAAGLLGIDDATRRDLHCAGHFDALMSARAGGDAFHVVVKGASGLLFSSQETFPTREEAEKAARDAYAGMRDEDAFAVEARAGTTTFELRLTSGPSPLTHRTAFDTEADATRAARAILDRYDGLLAADACDSEGMHLIEHILLRPRAADHALMPVCLPSDCTFCGEENPYSFRVSVVLPYWPPRFRDLGFRATMERLLREEAPAHVQVRVCWIGQSQMTQLDSLHRAWLTALRTGRPATIRLRAKRLIALLSQLVSVYPAAHLHDCDRGDDESVIRLGGTALGIF